MASGTALTTENRLRETRRFLLALIVLILIGGLLTGIFLLINRVVPPLGVPRHYDEYVVTRARIAADTAADTGDAQAAADYVIALVESGQTSKARNELSRARALDLDVTRTQALLIAEGRLLEAEGEYTAAVDCYTRAADELRTAYEAQLEKDVSPNWAVAYGMPANYYVAHLRLATLALDAADWEQAIEHLDSYLEGNPQDGGVYIDRGNAWLHVGDKKAALADFEQALKYLPDDQEALEGKRQAEEQ
ncbi:MAG: tetratricopeptide repeat protein [Actinomycetes bacterium]|jgi:tetratricopeptide (TPR) repeat protein|nr:tetratricopeptide repeat protein [Actinomycetes bacterium]